MIDHQELVETAGIDNLTVELKKFLNDVLKSKRLLST